jgi:OOP family OmpA-OmpF porin
MKFKLAAAIAALSGVCATSAAWADEDAGAYVGGGLGQFNVEIDDFDDVDDTFDNYETDDTAYKLFGGYRISKFLAAEIAYINLGSPSQTVLPGVRVESEVDGFAPYVVGTIPIGNWFEVFGKLGYYFYDANFRVEDELNGTAEFDEESESLVYGAGVGANFGKFNVRLEYEKLDLEDVDDANTLWLTAAYKF